MNAGLNFLLLPILTKHLTPADYGIISLVNTYVSVFIPIIGLSTAGFAVVEYYDPKLPREEFPHLFSSVRVIPLIGTAVLALLFLIGSPFLPGIMELPLTAYWLVVPLTLLTLYFTNFSTFLVATKRAGLFAATSIARLVAETLLTVALVVWLGRAWNGRIESALAIAGIFSVGSFYFYRKWGLISWNIRKTYIRQAVLFGTPLIMHQIGKFVINQSDRIFLTKMVSLDEMGIYSVGYQVGTVILIVVTAFSNFFSPFLYEKLAKGGEEEKREVIRVSYWSLIGTLACVFLLTLATPIIFRYFVDPSYAGAAKYVFWVGLGYFFWAIYIVFSGYIFFLKKTKVLGYIAIVNVALNLLLNFLFIRYFGAIGAAYATCLSYLIVAIIISIVVNRMYPMPWKDFWIRRRNKNAESQTEIKQ